MPASAFRRFLSRFGDPSPHRLPAAARLLLARIAAGLPGACALCAATGPHALCEGCRTQYFSESGQPDTMDRRGDADHAGDGDAGSKRDGNQAGGVHDGNDIAIAGPTRSAPRCGCCALPLTPSGEEDPAPWCIECAYNAPEFDATVFACDYAAPVDQLVLALKYGGRLALAPLLASLLRDAMLRRDGPELPLPDCLTVVPLGAARLRERGFNQAVEIARPLSRSLGVPLDARMLVRVRETMAQAGFSRHDRQHNLIGAFALAPRPIGEQRDLRGLHVGVVDDVMTTGETLSAVASVLKQSGAARVTNIVFARTLPMPARRP